jgi:hypothetical protein
MPPGSLVSLSSRWLTDSVFYAQICPKENYAIEHEEDEVEEGKS